MIEIRDVLAQIAEHPAVTTVTATATAVAGLVSKFTDILPIIHDIISDLSMLVGIVACVALARVHILRGNREAMENEEFHLHRRKDDTV